MNFPNRYPQQLLISFLVLTIGLVVGYQAGQKNLIDRNDFKPQAILVNEAQPAEYEEVDFQQFWQVWQILEENYLDPEKLDAKAQVHGAIKGMTGALGDPYTVYLPPTEQKRSQEDLAGAFYGVGIQLGYIDETLAVIAPLKGTPAEQAGVKAGDLILHIKDDTKDLDIDTNDLSLTDAVNHIRGNRGVPVTLTLYREGQDRPFDVDIKRDEIVVPSVELSYLEQDGGRAAVITLSRFGDRTDSEWEQIVTEIQAQSSLSGIILDLRNNPGGYLDGAIDIASEFIPDGLVVSQEGRFRTQPYSVNHNGRLTNLPVTVVINKGSASASEIVAGALRDRRGAKLIGENSFGKGTVQDAMDLEGGAGLHVTVGRWLLPSGEWIHDKGLPVSQEVVDDPETEPDEALQAAFSQLSG